MSSVWNLAGNKATLRADKMSAMLELGRPDKGIILTDADHPRSHLLRLLSPRGSSAEKPKSVVDCYVRGNDLVVTYSQIHDELTSQVYYRYFEHESRSPAIDFVLSRQTELLDSDPHTMVSSRLTCGESLFFNRERFDAIPLPSGESVATESCLFIHRWANRDVSYVEMIHPSDFETCIVRGESNAVQVDRTLFQHRLEKGVIRRGQVRCALVERRHDLQTSQQMFEQFQQADPPLTT